MKLGSAVFALLGLVCSTASGANAEAQVLLPEHLIEARRPSASLINDEGTHALIPVQQFSARHGNKSQSIYYVSLGKAPENIRDLNQLIFNGSEPVFLAEKDFAYLKGNTLCQARIESSFPGQSFCHSITTFPTSVQNLRSVRHSPTNVTLVFSAKVYEDGTLDGVQAAEQSEAVQDWKNHARVYDTLLVRHWDQWVNNRQKSQLFALNLSYNHLLSRWHASGSPRALMKGTQLETPVGPLGSAADFAVSDTHVAFTAKDPNKNSAWHTKQNLYLVPLNATSGPVQVSVNGRGWCGSPAFSPDGQMLVFLQQYEDGLESDRKEVQIYSLLSQKQSSFWPDWDMSPSELAFTRNGSHLLLTVVEDEQTKLYRAEVHRKSESKSTLKQRQLLVDYGHVLKPHELLDGRIAFTRSTFDYPNDLFVLEPNMTITKYSDFLHMSAELPNLDLGKEAEQFSYSGKDNVTAHGWYMEPPQYEQLIKDGGKVPLCVLIHGGPESDWNNGWSTRWNPRVFAAAGFAVIMLDPSGSTGFGQEYTNRILKHWGDRPYVDIMNGVHYILDTKPHLDRDRVVGAGGSFGGYMVNWIQGHNDDHLFKALVTHDGMFNTLSTFYTTDELYFAESEFGGVPWEVHENYERFSPHHYVHRWNTPHLIVHGGQDFRLDPSEGIAAFAALQRRGIPSRYVYFPNEGHWVLDPKNSQIWHTEVLNWLTKWILPKNASESLSESATESVLEQKQQPQPILVQEADRDRNPLVFQ
ncbi:hypothetical protein MPSI1_002229 [Malassezia psittaci]|uniref:Dipeptidyl-peptidase V n=1 Tax=Malassezia psittaci TaxID=1821823 RepID=A0AAF0F5Q3_9BASI|nr:hypothetical protein MPSI1_002229 [Malassezia psittaci]